MYTAAHTLYEELKSGLLNGQVAVLPSERELCRSHRLGRHAVRSALQQLEDEHLILLDQRRRRRISSEFPSQLRKVAILRTANPLFNNTPEALELLMGVSQTVRRLGGDPCIFFANADSTVKLTELEESASDWSGIIGIEDCIGSALGNDYPRLHAQGVPIVIANYEARYSPPIADLPCSKIDFRDIGRLGGRALVNAGRTRLACIAKPTSGISDEIAAGLRGVLAEDNLRFNPAFQFNQDITDPDGGDAAIRSQLLSALQGHDRPDGFVVFRHNRLFPLLQCCDELGLRLRHDLDIVFYDCTDRLDYRLPPGLLFLEQPVGALASEAVHILAEWTRTGPSPQNRICALTPARAVAANAFSRL